MKKVLLIGLDGASFDFLMPWIEEGKLPVFEKLIKGGAQGTLKSTIPCLTCPALPTIYTGMNPGNLGIFSFVNSDGSIISSSNIPYKSLWTILTENNNKSLISNLRTTYPPEEINGVMICSLHALAQKVGVDSWERTQSSWVYPKELQNELDGWAIDGDNFINNIRMKLIANDPEGYQNIKRLEEFRAAKFKKLLLRDDYNFAFHWIEHTDTLNHLCWNNKELILQFYQEVIEPILDDYLNTFKDWNILFISDHGGAEQTLYDFHINKWLKNKGYLKANSFYPAELISRSIGKIKNIIPDFVLSQLYKFQKNRSASGDKKHFVLPDNKYKIIGVDWDNTVAYADINWGVRINKTNIKGDYDKLRDKIISDLKEIEVSPGQSLMQNVWKKEEIFSGKYIDQIPDIITLPQNYVLPSIMISNKILTPCQKSDIGNHSFARNAIFMSYGPDIAKNKAIDPLNLYDIMPTILHMLDIDIPRELDGKVAMEIFDVESEYFKKQVNFSDVSLKRTNQVRGLYEEEEKEIKKMLKGLGYFE